MLLLSIEGFVVYRGGQNDRRSLRGARADPARKSRIQPARAGNPASVAPDGTAGGRRSQTRNDRLGVPAIASPDDPSGRDRLADCRGRAALGLSRKPNSRPNGQRINRSREPERGNRANIGNDRLADVTRILVPTGVLRLEAAHDPGHLRGRYATEKAKMPRSGATKSGSTKNRLMGAGGSRARGAVGRTDARREAAEGADVLFELAGLEPRVGVDSSAADGSLGRVGRG